LETPPPDIPMVRAIMVLQDRAVIRRDGEFPFYSFKPNPLRSCSAPSGFMGGSA
jgi:hypothetical protein